MAKKSRGQKKRLETLAKETESQKQALVAQLQKMPIAQLACERVSVGRSTYYKWRMEDRVFARAADKAKEAGQFLINDVAESRLIRLIQNDNLGAIIFWLKKNHPKYTDRLIHEYSLVREPRSVEEEQASADRLAMMLARRANLFDFSTEEVRAQLTAELGEDFSGVQETPKEPDEKQESKIKKAIEQLKNPPEEE